VEQKILLQRDALRSNRNDFLYISFLTIALHEMATLSKSYKLAFLSNIIKNEIVGNGVIPKDIQQEYLDEKNGDDLMKLLRDIFTDAKIDFKLSKNNNNDNILPITSSLKKKYLQHNDIIFNRICYMRLITICNFFLQNNTVNGTIPCLTEVKETGIDNLVAQMQTVSLSGNHDVVHAVDQMKNTLDAELKIINTAVTTSITKNVETAQIKIVKHIDDASAVRTKEAEEIKKLLKDLVQNNAPLPLRNSTKSIKKKGSESRAPPTQKKNLINADDEINNVLVNKGIYFVYYNKDSNAPTEYNKNTLTEADIKYLDDVINSKNEEYGQKVDIGDVNESKEEGNGTAVGEGNGNSYMNGNNNAERDEGNPYKTPIRGPKGTNNKVSRKGKARNLLSEIKSDSDVGEGNGNSYMNGNNNAERDEGKDNNDVEENDGNSDKNGNKARRNDGNMGNGNDIVSLHNQFESDDFDSVYSDDFEPAGADTAAPPTVEKTPPNTKLTTPTSSRNILNSDDDDDTNYSDNFEQESTNDREKEFLQVVFNELGMKGVSMVTDAGIRYLYNGLIMNKALYKKNYRAFFKEWELDRVDIVSEKDKAIIKDLFANVHEIDFDHDYLCLVGKDLELKWISYVRLAMYEKYIMMHFFTNFEQYDIVDCVAEAMRNFIYDYCYLSTLMFENVD